MRENNRNSIEIEKMLPQFTTMNVIDGQAGLMSYSSLIFYSLTIDNILNIIVLLILAGVTIATLVGDNGIITNEGYEGNPIFAQPVNAIRTSINNFEKGRIPTIEEILNSAINFTEAYNQLLSICANLSPLVEPLVAESTFEEAESSNGNYVEKYGYLYTYIAAEQAIPEGWRLPTDEDWKSLETALGMLPEDLDILDEWRGNGQGDVLKEGGCGFDVIFGGSRMYGNFAGVGKSPYVDKGSYECFWTSTPYMQNDSTELAITRGFSVFSNGILRGTSDKTAAYHVRCVKDAN